MKKIRTIQDFESEAIKAITQAGLTIDNPDDAMHVRVVKFLSGRAMYSLSFTDIDGIDYNGTGSTPDIAIAVAIESNKTFNDIRI